MAVSQGGSRSNDKQKLTGVHADQKSITTMSAKPIEPATFFTGSYDGRVCAYNVAEGDCKAVEGSGPTAAIVAVCAGDDGKASLVSMDDAVREIASSSGHFAFA